MSLGAGALVVATPLAALASSPVHQRLEVPTHPLTAGSEFSLGNAISGSTVVLGAPGVASGAGAVYVYEKSGSKWSPLTTITASDAAAGANFGISVGISGTTIIVGAQGANGARGSVYFFSLNVGKRKATQIAEYKSPGSPHYGQLGWSVAISGTTAVAGAPNVAGAVEWFTVSGGKWVAKGSFAAPDTAANDGFGVQVAMGSPTSIFVIAQGHNASTGELYVFDRTGRGWVKTAEMKGADSVAGDLFGSGGVSVSGANVLVGDPYFNAGAGASYVFTISKGKWKQTAELHASVRITGDHFGFGAISGSTIVIGADKHNALQGAAYLFTRSGTKWTQKALFTGSHSVAGDVFGRTVSLSGTTAVVGSLLHASEAGEAYIFSV
jgi:hypothetical protein